MRPATLPMYRTVPYMAPGTSTVSPTARDGSGDASSPAAPAAFIIGGRPGVSGAILRFEVEAKLRRPRVPPVVAVVLVVVPPAATAGGSFSSTVLSAYVSDASGMAASEPGVRAARDCLRERDGGARSREEPPLDDAKPLAFDGPSVACDEYSAFRFGVDAVAIPEKADVLRRRERPAASEELGLPAAL